jgi:capsular polysaccharide biosynthesis protein
VAVTSARRLTFVEDVEPLARRRGWRFEERAPAGTSSYGPSGALREDLAEVFDHLEAYVARHHATVHHSYPPERVRGYFERLYCVTSLATPRAFVCEIPGAHLVGPTGVAATGEGEVLLQSNLRGGRRAAKVALVGRVGALDAAPLLEGPVVSLLSHFADNYAHWLQDCLPRLALVPEGIPYRVLVPSPPQPFHLESLELLGIAADRIVELREPALRAERLLLAVTATRCMHPAPAPLLEVAARLRAASGAGHAAGPGRRVYASRGGRRRVVDEEALWPVLDRNGFEPVRCSRLSVAEQIALFAGAEVVAGPHGADLHNALFSPAHANVVELFSPRYVFLNVLRTTAFTRQRHWHLLGETVSDDYAIRVDGGRLEALLAQVLG